MPSSTITIRVNGQWNGSGLQSAIKDLERLGSTASKQSSLYTSAAQRLAVQTASTSKSISSGLANASTDIVRFGNDLQNLGKRAQDVGSRLTSALTLPMVGVGAYAGAMAVQYDTALANVRKVTDMTEAELQSLADSALELSTTQPVTAEQLLNIEAMGAQLGVADERLESFAVTVSGLDIATNLSADEAAQQMARFANITGMADTAYQNYGSTIVALGNNLATTESEISNMAMRLAAAGDIAGMSEAEILGMAGAMSSLGIRAEAGGSAMTTIMSKISKAAAAGGADLEAYARVAGMSAQEFAAAWKSSPMDALQALLQGIHDLDASGQDMNVTLSELGINEIRQSDAVRRLANDTTVLSDAVNLATTAWDENTALTNEVEQRNESLASRLQTLKNRVDEIAINVGGPMVEALIAALDAGAPLLDFAADAARAFADMDEDGQRTVLMLAGLAGAAGPAVSVMGKITSAVGSAVSALGHFGQNVAVYQDALLSVDGAQLRAYASADTMAGRIGIAGNAVVQAAGGVDAYVTAWEKAYDAEHSIEPLTDRLNQKIKEQSDLSSIASTATGKRAQSARKAADAAQEEVAALQDQISAAKRTRDENNRLIDGWKKQASESKKASKSIGEVADSMGDAADAAGDMATSSKSVRTGLQTVGDGARLAGGYVLEFVKAAGKIAAVTAVVSLVAMAIGELARQAAEAEERERRLAEASRTFADIAGEAASGAESQAAAMGDLAERISATTDELITLNESTAETLGDLETDAATLDAYISTIEELAGQSGLTATEQERLKNAVAGYNETTGDSVEVTNASHGELSKSTEEILKNADAWERNARAQAYQEMAIDYMRVQAEAQMNLTRAQEEQEAAQRAYNDEVERLMGLGQSESMARATAGVSGYGKALDEANTKLEEAQADYDSATQSVEELTAAQVMLSESAQEIKGALSGFGDSFVDELAGAGVGLDSLTVALADAGISVEQLSELGSERIAALAQAFDGNVEQMVWAIQNYNNVPFIDKEGNVTVDDQELIDAQGRVVVWNGTQFVYKDTQAAVNDADLIDAQGNLYTWNGSTLLPKSATGNITTNLDSVIAWRNDWNNGTLLNKFATGSVNVVQSVRRIVSDVWNGRAAGGIRLNAAGGVRAHASGFIATGPTFIGPRDVIGEDGAEAFLSHGGRDAIVPLTNRRYSQPFADIVAEGVNRRLLAAARPVAEPAARRPAAERAVGAAGNTYVLTINGERRGSMSAEALEAIEVLFGEFGLTSDMGVQ